MRTKLTLKLENLSVESFETTAIHPEKGTVFGEEELCTCLTQCTCPGCLTCDETCADSCNGTCFPACPRPTKEETCPFTCDITGCSWCVG